MKKYFEGGVDTGSLSAARLTKEIALAKAENVE